MPVSTPPLALSNLINISVQVSPSQPLPPTFNQGLFIGNSAVIPSYGSNPRVRRYGPGATAALAGMVSDGFSITSPEYVAAQIYFSQTQPPVYIWIGRQDLTALQIITIDAAGTGWAVGDQFTVVQGGASFGVGQVLAETGGVPSSIAVVSGMQGTGYAVATGLTTTAVSPSTGINLTVNVTVVGETLLQSAVACRAANSTWYGLAVYNPVDADNLALAEWADPLWQTTRYYPWSNDAAIAAGTANNLALQLQTLELRVLGIYATTQGGLFPNNIYAAAGLMGVEMGLNTGLAGSFFTAAYKEIIGIAPEPLTEAQYTAIVAAGFNVYGSFGPYETVQPGFMSNGSPSYLWLNLAMLVAQLQYAEMDVLTSLPAVPQTNSGEHLLLQAANNACQLLANIGFLATGIWEGVAISIPGVTLTPGQSIAGGFLNQAQPYSQQLSADRAAGKAMPIYCAVTTAGAVQSLVIGVYTQL
jgi:hypothetical protein